MNGMNGTDVTNLLEQVTRIADALDRLTALAEHDQQPTENRWDRDQRIRTQVAAEHELDVALSPDRPDDLPGFGCPAVIGTCSCGEWARTQPMAHLVENAHRLHIDQAVLAATHVPADVEDTAITDTITAAAAAAAGQR